MFLPDFVCLSVCVQDNSKSYGRIFLKFWGYVGNGINYQWFNFGRDPAGILDSGSLWNFRYHCVKGGIREPLAKRRWWRHLSNSFALAEVPAGYDCVLVYYLLDWCRTENLMEPNFSVLVIVFSQVMQMEAVTSNLQSLDATSRFSTFGSDHVFHDHDRQALCWNDFIAGSIAGKPEQIFRFVTTFIEKTAITVLTRIFL